MCNDPNYDQAFILMATSDDDIANDNEADESEKKYTCRAPAYRSIEVS